jgi:hypothetical protein
VLATSPALFEVGGDRFLGYGVAREGRVTPGDHLQTIYNLWLPGHQLARGHAPWLDPYSFQPELPERVNLAGWPFAAVFGPLEAGLGAVAGWNVFVLLSYVGAGGFAALWLRALGLPLGATLAGGLVFALAPYRVAQSTGHLLGPISILLPLALYGVERRLSWLAVAALASIPLSGQVHLALGAIPFVLAYAWARGRWKVGVVAAAAGVAAGVAVWALTLDDAVERPFSEVERYSASLGDFVARDPGEFERFLYLGWLTPLAALTGLVVLRRRRALAAVLGLGVLVPCVLALGANLPGYRTLWAHSPLHSTRVPERLLPIASLCVAALVAFALERLCVVTTQSLPGRPSPVPERLRAFGRACVATTQAHARLLTVAALLLIAADLWVPLYDPLNADEGNAVYAALNREPPGRVLELPTLLPDAYTGSVYLYYSMQAPRERPLGYSTAAPPQAFATARALAPNPDDRALLQRLGVRYVVEHRSGKPTGYVTIP